MPMPRKVAIGDTKREKERAMHNAYVVTGIMSDSRTVTLDEPLPLAAARVRLVVEPVSEALPGTYQQTIAAIRERQRSRGHRAPSREEVDAQLRAERESWPE
jgi:hypothetical protein